VSLSLSLAFHFSCPLDLISSAPFSVYVWPEGARSASIASGLGLLSAPFPPIDLPFPPRVRELELYFLRRARALSLGGAVPCPSFFSSEPHPTHPTDYFLFYFALSTQPNTYAMRDFVTVALFNEGLY
jgi:hypothetical protein